MPDVSQPNPSAEEVFNACQLTLEAIKSLTNGDGNYYDVFFADDDADGDDDGDDAADEDNGDGADEEADIKGVAEDITKHARDFIKYVSTVGRLQWNGRLVLSAIDQWGLARPEADHPAPEKLGDIPIPAEVFGEPLGESLRKLVDTPMLLRSEHADAIWDVYDVQAVAAMIRGGASVAAAHHAATTSTRRRGRPQQPDKERERDKRIWLKKETSSLTFAEIAENFYPELSAEDCKRAWDRHRKRLPASGKKARNK
jgi:hypothetical protein